MNRKLRTFNFRAIRGAWAVASRARRTELLQKDDGIRAAMVAAWKAGYRNAVEDQKRKQVKR